LATVNFDLEFNVDGLSKTNELRNVAQEMTIHAHARSTITLQTKIVESRTPAFIDVEELSVGVDPETCVRLVCDWIRTDDRLGG
jgi:hypothetical protein